MSGMLQVQLLSPAFAGVVERSKAAALNTEEDESSVGSNPTPA